MHPQYSATGTPVLDDKAAKPPLMPATAIQVSRDLYASSIAPRVHQYWTTRREAAPDAGNGDAGEMRSLCICHSATGTPVLDDKAAKPPLMPASGDAGEMRSLCIFLVLHRKKDTSDA
jgi:hypothetical protein